MNKHVKIRLLAIVWSSVMMLGTAGGIAWGLLA